VDLLTSLTTFAAAGVPGDSPSARLAVPLGILVFFGSIYLLLRANLGTRRGYLVLATSFFGFMIIMSLFWTFGAPGTPQMVGPSHLPGQESDAYEPAWVPFAGDSLIAEEPDYQFVQDYPDGFEEVPDGLAGAAETGTEEIIDFFAETEHKPVTDFDDDWEAAETRYAEAPNGFRVIAVTLEPPAEEGEEEAAGEGEDAAAEDEEAVGEGEDAAAEEEEDPAAEDEEAAGEGEDAAAEEEEVEPVTLFAYFDEGAVRFPGYVFIGLALAGFLLHAVLLNADEAREQRDLAEVAPEEEKVPAGA